MTQSSLFDALPGGVSPTSSPNVMGPLAARMRPQSLLEYVGQEHLLGPGKILSAWMNDSVNPLPDLPSLIFWGPPGTGKTSLAYLLARRAASEFHSLSAVSSGIKEVREYLEKIRHASTSFEKRPVLFIDEIHRFNKSQQDALLQAIEEGLVTLLGATTENPSFEVNAALLSRCRVLTLELLTAAQLRLLLERALEDRERGLGQEGKRWQVDESAWFTLIRLSGGDARSALNGLELAARLALAASPQMEILTLEESHVLQAFQRAELRYDRQGEEHYNVISALHKSIRHSDPDAALYYLAVMMEAGEDPLFIARRLVRAASEDIGMADPQALIQCLAAQQTVQFLGYPECDTALAQATVYLSCAPKSNALYKSVQKLRQELRSHGARPVPLAYRNAPTALMKDLGYGENYQYDHDWPQKISPQEALPAGLENRRFYEPGDLGFEKEVSKRLDYFRKVRENLRKASS